PCPNPPAKSRSINPAPFSSQCKERFRGADSNNSENRAGWNLLAWFPIDIRRSAGMDFGARPSLGGARRSPKRQDGVYIAPAADPWDKFYKPQIGRAHV